MAWALLWIMFGICVGLMSCAIAFITWLVILDRRDARARR